SGEEDGMRLHFSRIELGLIGGFSSQIQKTASFAKYGVDHLDDGGSAATMEPVMQSNPLVLIVPLALSLLASPRVFAQSDSNQTSTPAQLVDALNGVFGKQTDNRAVHAKGVILHGTFKPSPDAAKLSKAAHFAGPDVPITVR